MKSNSRHNVKFNLAALLMIVGVLMSVPAARGENPFDALAEMPQVESTYISGRFAHSMQTWINVRGDRSIDFSQGFSEFYTYKCYSQESVRKARRLLDDFLKRNPDYELVMQSKMSQQDYRIYERFGDDGLLHDMIIWTGDAPNVSEIVVVEWKKGLKKGNKYSDSSAEER